MSLIFTPLVNGNQIERCSELLENRMQCYTGASFIMTDSSDDSIPERQVCRYHARLLYEIEQRKLATQTKLEEKEKQDGSTN